MEKVAKIAAGKHRDYAVSNNYDKLEQLDNRNERFDVFDHSVHFFALVRADEVVSGKRDVVGVTICIFHKSGGTYVYMKMCTVELSVPMKTAISSEGTRRRRLIGRRLCSEREFDNLPARDARNSHVMKTEPMWWKM